MYIQCTGLLEMSFDPLSCPPLSLPLQASAKCSGAARLGRLVIHRAEPEMGPLSKSTTVSKAISKKAALIMSDILWSKKAVTVVSLF